MLSVSINKFVIILRNKLGNIYGDLRYPTMLKLGISNLTHVFLQVNSSFNEKMVDFPGIYHSVYICLIMNHSVHITRKSISNFVVVVCIKIIMMPKALKYSAQSIFVNQLK